MEKIDFILPWVDPTDPVWQYEKKQHEKKYNLDQTDSNSPARYRDIEILKFVLRSIEKNCPWFNKIYIITAGHFPIWLDINSDKLELIKHSDLYFNKSHLPTFNSNSIEMNLAKLNQISDKFVYMNDDLVIMNPLKESRFFKNNKPVDFLCHGWMKRGYLFSKIRKIDTFVSSVNNNLHLINKKMSPRNLSNNLLFDSSYSLKNKISNFIFLRLLNRYLWLEHWHHPQPYMKKTIIDVYNEFSNEMMECSKNKFRSMSDLNPYLYRYWALTSGNFYPDKKNDGLVKNISSIDELDKIINTLSKRNDINFVCFNDSIHLTDTNFLKIKNTLHSFLLSKFPEPSSFEK
ncbi:Stealth CR1 domain-containing protein [Morganella morganii]|uniref:stealth family protein n=1 Tax=Morganella morganii TaxID=582 RepID=UPI0034E42760